MSSSLEEKAETGVDVIDAGHERIAEIFGDLFQSLTAGADHEAVVADLARLVDAICEHIECENDLMTKIGYQGAAAHRADHDDYFIRLSQLLVDCQKHNHCLADRVRHLHELWCGHHQRRFDRPLAAAYRELVESRPVSPAGLARRSICL